MWFRRDLRLADHPALTAAASAGPVVGLFVVDPAFDLAGAPRRAFLARCLAELNRSMGGALVVRYGDPEEVVPAVATEANAANVFVTADFGPYGRRRDDGVARALDALGRRLVQSGSPYAVAPGTVVSHEGRPYRVFTPFSRTWWAVGWDAPIPAPRLSWSREVRSEAPLAEPGLAVDLPPAGETAAQRRLASFVADDLTCYDIDRDRPDLDTTSHLSPYVRWGCLHPRQILSGLGSDPAHERFRAELAWREFYADVLFNEPTSAWWNYDRSMDEMPIDDDEDAEERFVLWADGWTGYPIIDAGMRQLLAMGWMHNRVRMLTASFLVKDLHLPWQWGARHFLDHLVDGDLASNNHGWQWVAGTGTDPAPYFRIFNPVVQGKRFDPDGVYVRRWVPELVNVPDRHIHEPWLARRGVPLDYTSPMIDHEDERVEALRRYDQVTGRKTPSRRPGTR
jgi:deoxyribodipyrimidine photo-lyase